MDQFDRELQTGQEQPPEADHREFTRELLRDLQALERMLREDRIESDITRIGAEQELFLVDRDYMPAPLAIEMLQAIDDPHFTTELARFNIEINADPLVFEGDCLSELEKRLGALVAKANAAAADFDSHVVLVGILPSLMRVHAGLDYMTPKERYYKLNEIMTRLRGGPYDLRIKGRDELMLRHDNVMLEACNTSFQVHLQVAGRDFVPMYNVAQWISGPVLAAMANSPLLYDRQLWSESRIALFQQGTDDRSRQLSHLRSRQPRVSFGTRWLKRSAVEAFEEDIARFRTIFGTSLGENAVTELEEGRIPKLRALCKHNGTVYRWNRPCYGISNGKPHLRIECRYIPSGPSIVDEIANTAFWLGLMRGAFARYGDPAIMESFGTARKNFLAAARSGLGAQFTWFEGRQVPARRLLLEELIPLAGDGLRSMGCNAADIKRYLGIIEQRVTTRQTGAAWLTASHDALKDADTVASRAAGLVREMVEQQHSGRPVHEWPTLTPERTRGAYCATVDQLMSTDLFTVHPDELIHLAAHVMDWKHVRHVPVEDDKQRLVGLISHRVLLRVLARQATAGESSSTRARDIMTSDVISVPPDTPTLDAIDLMQEKGISCLPVTDADGVLVGIMTERDLVKIAAPLMRSFLGRSMTDDR